MSMSDTDAVDNWQRAWQRDQTDVRYDEVSGHLYACFRTSVVGSICGRKQQPASVVGRICGRKQRPAAGSFFVAGCAGLELDRG